MATCGMRDTKHTRSRLARNPPTTTDYARLFLQWQVTLLSDVFEVLASLHFHAQVLWLIFICEHFESVQQVTASVTAG